MTTISLYRPMMRFPLARAALAVSIILLAGCGGGSDSAPSPVPPVQPPATVTLGATVDGLGAGNQLSLVNNGGQSIKVSANGAVALPAVPAGSAYEIVVSEHPTGQFCEVAHGTGTAAGAVSAQVTCRTAHVYMTGLLSTPTGHGGKLDEHTFYHFTLRPDGLLQLSATPPKQAAESYRTGRMTVEPGGRYAYVHDGLGFVWYAIDAQGELAARPTHGAGAYSQFVAVTPDQRFLYTFRDDQTSIDHFQLEQGKPNPDMHGYVELPGTGHYRMTFDPTSKHAYVLDDDRIVHMTVGSDGKLTSAGMTLARTRNFLVAPDGKHAYGVDVTGELLRHYVIGVDGTLAERDSTRVNASGFERSLALSRNGKFMYVTGGAGIAQFAVRDDGSLSPLQPAVVERPSGAYWIVLEATGRQAYVGTPAGTLEGYAIGADGTLEIKSTYSLPDGRQILDFDLFYR